MHDPGKGDLTAFGKVFARIPVRSEVNHFDAMEATGPGRRIIDTLGH